jgi:shikimate kinase
MSKHLNVFLIGPMGAGKTTVGKLLAANLKMPFKDTDREIEARSGADIGWIFDVEGEEGFRDRESLILDELSQESPILLATGGGIVLREENRQILRSRGFVVYLSATVEQQIERTSRDRKRPLLQTDNPGEVIEKLMKIRDPLYRSVADLIEPTNSNSPRTMAKELVLKLRDAMKG